MASDLAFGSGGNNKFLARLKTMGNRHFVTLILGPQILGLETLDPSSTKGALYFQIVKSLQKNFVIWSKVKAYQNFTNETGPAVTS